MDRSRNEQEFKSKFESADTVGYWFATVVLVLVVAAGSIVYQRTRLDTGLAVTEVAVAGQQSDNVDFVPTRIHIEGVDP